MGMGKWVQPMLNPRDCIHGHLARSCELCERDELIHDLRDENARLREFAFGGRPEWEAANATLKHRVRELEAELAAE